VLSKPPTAVIFAGGGLLETEAVKIAASQGLWAVLFVALLFYVLRTNEKREERLLSCLDKLGDRYDTLDERVERVEENVSEIKDDVKELKGRV